MHLLFMAAQRKKRTNYEIYRSQVQHDLRKNRVATYLGSVREKQIFLQVREMSGNFGHLNHVRELSGNCVMSYQGIVREFCHDIIFRLKFPSYYKGSTWVIFT